jgi:hypothetical protein
MAGLRRIIDMQIHSVGIDLGKTTFHLVALSATGKVLLRKKFTQKQLTTFTANMQTSLIGMEACSGSLSLRMSRSTLTRMEIPDACGKSSTGWQARPAT